MNKYVHTIMLSDSNIYFSQRFALELFSVTTISIQTLTSCLINFFGCVTCYFRCAVGGGRAVGGGSDTNLVRRHVKALEIAVGSWCHVK